MSCFLDVNTVFKLGVLTHHDAMSMPRHAVEMEYNHARSSCLMHTHDDESTTMMTTGQPGNCHVGCNPCGGVWSPCLLLLPPLISSRTFRSDFFICLFRKEATRKTQEVGICCCAHFQSFLASHAHTVAAYAVPYRTGMSLVKTRR